MFDIYIYPMVPKANVGFTDWVITDQTRLTDLNYPDIEDLWKGKVADGGGTFYQYSISSLSFAIPWGEGFQIHLLQSLEYISI